MTDRRADVPPFQIEGVTFTAWVVAGGHAYEWRSACGRMTAARAVSRMDPVLDARGEMVGRREASTYRAALDGRVIGDTYTSLVDAMAAVARAERIDRTERRMSA